MQKQSKSKMVIVRLSIDDIQNDPFFFSVPGEVSDPNMIREVVLKKYFSNLGILEAFVDDTHMVLQWVPDRVNQQAEALYTESQRLVKERKFNEAIVKLQQAIRLNDQDAEYFYKLGLVYFEKKAFQDSIGSLQKAVEICPIHYKAFLLLGINWVKLRKLQKAESKVLQAMRLNPKSVQVFLNMGAILSYQKRFNEAIDMFQRALDLSPRESRAFLGLARIYTMLGDVDASNMAYRKVIELAPGTQMAEFAKRSITVTDGGGSGAAPPANREELFTKGMVFFLSGRYRESSTQYKRYLMSHPRDDYGWYLMGESKLRTGENEEAASCFKQAIKINSRRGLYFKALGIALHYLGKPREVVEVLKKSSEYGKNDSLCYTLMGVNFLRMRKFDESIKNLQQALKRDPNNPLALYNLALTHVQLEENEKAMDLLEKMDNLPLLDNLKAKAGKLLKTISAAM
jgi:tetratricopeptide (TPR) repeat protein